MDSKMLLLAIGVIAAYMIIFRKNETADLPAVSDNVVKIQYVEGVTGLHGVLWGGPWLDCDSDGRGGCNYIWKYDMSPDQIRAQGWGNPDYTGGWIYTGDTSNFDFFRSKGMN